jgi:hypothetical protein
MAGPGSKGNMRLRRWVGWIAVVSMLWHAATVARHDVFLFEQVTATQLAALAEAFGAGAICHSSAADAEEGKAPQKSPANGSPRCPICLGLASAHALPASGAAALRVPQTFITVLFVHKDKHPAPQRRLRHAASRGPPSIA